MSSVMVIVSKAVFEKQGGEVGEVYATDGYASLHKSLDTLADGGSIFLVTVRPPDEALWLVGVVDAPKQGKTGWTGKPNALPIRDISALKSKLTFTSGTGITAKPGALGMSLQTPRVLTDADVALLRGGKASAKAASAKAEAKPAAAKSPTSKAAGSKAAGPKAAGPKAAGSKAAGSKAAGSKPVTSKPATSKLAASASGSGDGTRSDSGSGSRSGSGTGPGTGNGTAAGPSAVLAALQAKDSAGALVATLAWWRASRSPEVADLLDAISQKVSGAPETADGTWAKLARTGDPVVLGRLLAGVPELPTSFLPAAAEMLAGFAPDPRLATALAAWIFEPPTTSSSTHAFWTKTLDLVAKTGDARHVAAFAKRVKKADGTSQFWPKLFNGIAKLLKKLAEVPAVASAPTAKLLAAAQKLPPIDERRASGIVAARVAAKSPATPALTGPALDQAAQHLAAGRLEAAIDAMATHWREHRAPEVADLVERANRLLPTWRRPLASTEKEIHAAWQEAFQTPSATMPQLLENLGNGTVKEMEIRLVDLANLPDDPRTAMRLAQLVRSGLSPERAQVWKSLWSLLARHRDIRSVARLRKEFNDFTSKYWYHHQHGKRLYGPFAFAPGEFPLPAGDAPRVTALGKAIDAAEKTARKKERELIAAIVAAPGEDAPRAVYADWLLEQGHPRGELINTALAGGDTKALEKTPEMFGALSDLSRHFTLDRGLPVMYEPSDEMSALLVDELRVEPLAAVVDRLDLESFTPDGEAIESLQPYLDVFPNVARLINPPELAVLHAALRGWRIDGKDLVR